MPFILFGRTDPNPLQILARSVIFVVLVISALGVAGTVMHDPDACFPNCALNPSRVASVQDDFVASQLHRPADRFDVPLSVTVYGDSRAWYLAEGAKLVPGWNVRNMARQGCVFLQQSRFFERYYHTSTPSERSVSTQTTGEVLPCDSRTYLPSLQHVNIALVYAGTLYTVDVGVDSLSVHSPTEPSWARYVQENLVLQIRSMNADRVVVLATPASLASFGEHEGETTGWLWSDEGRITAVNEILRQAAIATGAIYLADFAEWVDSQPSDCQPDGAHFTIDCARLAALWIRDQLRNAA